MALIVENGTIVADANTYVSAADATAYALARGVTIANDKIELFVIKAMDFIESLRERYVGRLVQPYQVLSWPRNYVVVDCDFFPNNEIPSGIIKAQCQLCLEQANGVDIMPTSAAGAFVTQKTVGPISRSFSAQYSTVTPHLPLVDAALAPFLAGGGGLSVRRM